MDNITNMLHKMLNGYTDDGFKSPIENIFSRKGDSVTVPSGETASVKFEFFTEINIIRVVFWVKNLGKVASDNVQVTIGDGYKPVRNSILIKVYQKLLIFYI